MNLNLRKIGFDVECELKEAKFQMREEPVESKIDEPDKSLIRTFLNNRFINWKL